MYFLCIYMRNIFKSKIFTAQEYKFLEGLNGTYDEEFFFVNFKAIGIKVKTGK